MKKHGIVSARVPLSASTSLSKRYPQYSSIVVSTASMSVSDWIGANVFSVCVSAFTASRCSVLRDLHALKELATRSFTKADKMDEKIKTRFALRFSPISAEGLKALRAASARSDVGHTVREYIVAVRGSGVLKSFTSATGLRRNQVTSQLLA